MKRQLPSNQIETTNPKTTEDIFSKLEANINIIRNIATSSGVTNNSENQNKQIISLTDINKERNELIETKLNQISEILEN